MNKLFRSICICCLVIALLLPCFMGNIPVAQASDNSSNALDDHMFTLSTLTSTDAVGRTLDRISGYDEDKHVGLFYFLWHGQHAADKPRNVTELLKTNYKDLFDASPSNTVVPYGSWLHYQEPLYGYYNSLDQWVMRKHIEMFIAAGVDFLVMDFTNGVLYPKPLRNLMDLLLEYKEAGWDVPEITFYINIDAQNLTERLYRLVYKDKEYKQLAFYGNSSKPIIVSVPHELTDAQKEFFDVRASQWHRDQYPTTTFPYWTFSREWTIYKDMVNISAAQTGTAFSYVFEPWDGKEHAAWGRGYTTKTGKNGNVNAILAGANFQEGWNAAIQLDPDIVFITGWNEWVVQKRNLHDHMPDLCPYDFPDYTDNFNVEYSRDLEMTKIPTYVKGPDGDYVQEGYGDNYYLQLAYNIRKYKGISANTNTASPSGVSINLDGAITQWDQVNNRYISLSSDKIARDAAGFYSNTRYTQDKPDNFIKNVRVTYDNDNIYFCIETEENVTAHKQGKTNWMNLFIGVNGSDKGSWSSFNYVINRNPKSSTVTSLEYFTGTNTYQTKALCDVQYRVTGKYLQFQIPRSALGLEGDAFGFTFKVADGVQEESNILDYYVSGESFPIGRMAHIYETKNGIVPGGDDAGIGEIPGEDSTPGQHPGDSNSNEGGSDSAGQKTAQDNTLLISIVVILGALLIAIAAFIVIVLINKNKKQKIE